MGICGVVSIGKEGREKEREERGLVEYAGREVEKGGRDKEGKGGGGRWERKEREQEGGSESGKEALEQYKVLTFSAAVDKLSCVHPLCGYKQLFSQLISIRVPEHHPCKGSTSPRIMDDISNDTLQREEEG